MYDDSIPLSQLANQAFNPVVPYDASILGGGAGGAGGGAPTDFSGLGASLAAAAAGTGAPTGMQPPHPLFFKRGKLFQVPRGKGHGQAGAGGAHTRSGTGAHGAGAGCGTCWQLYC